MLDRVAEAHTKGQNTTQQAHHGDFLDEVKCQLNKIGFVLRQQCDPDIPRTYFPSGYLPNASAKDDNTTGKMAHKMRGVLLVVLMFMLSSRNREQLESKIGKDILPK